jgi:hypothetical protein
MASGPKSSVYAGSKLLGIYSARLYPTLIEHIQRKTGQTNSRRMQFTPGISKLKLEQRQARLQFDRAAIAARR